MKITIVSPEDENGVIASNGTKIFTENGTEITNITSIHIQYFINSPIEATIGVVVNPGTLRANALLTFDTLMEAAAAYGFELVPIEDE